MLLELNESTYCAACRAETFPHCSTHFPREECRQVGMSKCIRGRCHDLEGLGRSDLVGKCQ